MAKRKPPEQKVRTRLTAAGPDAVEFLIEAMHNEELTYKERIDIAKDLLNRGFGKTVQTEEEAPAIRVVLTEEARQYAD